MVLLELEMPEGAFSALRLDSERVLQGNDVLPLLQNGTRRRWYLAGSELCVENI